MSAHPHAPPSPASSRASAEPRIHPSAVVDPAARLADDVRVGPLCVVGGGVEIGPGCELVGSCTLLGPMRLGARNVVWPYAVLGAAPQDRSHRGEPTRLEVGEGNVFREHVTVHRGTAKDRAATRLGSFGMYLVGAHVAHDVVVGDHVVLANATLVGGHACVGDHVVTGGGAALAPFVHVGESAFVAGGACVERDVPPFVVAAGDRSRVRALNSVGLARRAAPAPSLVALERAFRLLFRGDAARAAGLEIARRELADDPWVQRLIAFLDASAARARDRGAKPR